MVAAATKGLSSRSNHTQLSSKPNRSQARSKISLTQLSLTLLSPKPSSSKPQPESSYTKPSPNRALPSSKAEHFVGLRFEEKMKTDCVGLNLGVGCWSYNHFQK